MGHRSLLSGQISQLKKFNLSKRHKFIVAVIFSSVILFYSEHFLGRSGVFIAIFLSIMTDIFLWWATRKDLKGNFSLQVFILPFLFSLAFGLFYFLIPARFLSRVIMTTLYAVGLYSLYLCQNIFVVASIRTIALLASARTTSFIITLVSYFFLANIIFSLHISILPVSIMLFVFSFILIYQSVWTYTLEKSLMSNFSWILGLSIALFELSFILWFWPGSPTLIALFLTGFFYTIVGLSHVWLDKRLFRGVLWEYVWVAVIVLFILILFTSWKG